MIKLHLLCVGKTKERWLKEALGEYEKRMQSEVLLKTTCLRDESSLLACLAKEGRAIGLDPEGRALSTGSFARLLKSELEEGGSRLTLFIGGAQGLPSELKAAYPLISLSKLTFTHQICRLVLVEQIYRAWTLWKGIPYHK